MMYLNVSYGAGMIELLNLGNFDGDSKLLFNGVSTIVILFSTTTPFLELPVLLQCDLSITEIKLSQN